MNQVGMFDYVVVHDRVERAAAEIDAIITTEKCRENHMEVDL